MDTFKDLLGAKIKLLRKNKGMNQADLAEATGVEINTISRYETGGISPSIEQLLNLARALGVSPMEILPPQDPVFQRVFALRKILAEKALLVESPEQLEELVQQADKFILSNPPPKKRGL